MKMLCKVLFYVLAVGVCGYTLVTEDEAVPKLNLGGLSAQGSSMTLGERTHRAMGAGVDNVMNSARGVMEGEIKSFVGGDEWEEIEASYDTFIAGVDTVKQAMSIVGNAYDNGGSEAGRKKLVAEGLAEGLKSGAGFTTGAVKTVTAMGKAAAMGAVIDGGMVSGPTAVALIGVGWVASKMVGGIADDAKDQMGEVIDAGLAVFVDSEGNEHEVRPGSAPGKILVKKPRVIQRYSPEKRREIERALMNKSFGGISDTIAEIAHMPEEIKESAIVREEQTRKTWTKEEKKQKRMEIERALLEDMAKRAQN